MSDALRLVIVSTVLLAMVGAIFGACFARLLWANDLKEAQRLQAIWDKTKSAMERTIDAQRHTIDLLKEKP